MQQGRHQQGNAALRLGQSVQVSDGQRENTRSHRSADRGNRVQLNYDSDEYSNLFSWANSSSSGVHSIFPASLLVHENSKDLELNRTIESFWAGDRIKVSDVKNGLRQVGQLASYSFRAPRASDLPPQRLTVRHGTDQGCRLQRMGGAARRNRTGWPVQPAAARSLLCGIGSLARAGPRGIVPRAGGRGNCHRRLCPGEYNRRRPAAKRTATMRARDCAPAETTTERRGRKRRCVCWSEIALPSTPHRRPMCITP